MIINHPVLNRLSPGIREATASINDDKLLIPNTFVLSGLPPEPLFRSIGAGGKVFESSFSLQSNVQVANAVAVTTPLGRLNTGWWKLFARGCYRSNYVLGTPTPGDFRFLFSDAVSNWQWFAIFAQTVGSQNFNYEAEFFLQNTLDISHIMDTNGVGQEQTCSLSIQANKLM